VLQQSCQYQSSPMWSQAELQGLYSASAASTSPATTIAPALSRSASESSDKNASLTSALYRMRQERNLSMMQREQTTRHPRVMQPLSVQPEGISPKMNPYLSRKIENILIHRVDYQLTLCDRHFPPYPRVYPDEGFL
jgi:regulatory protein SWI5